MTAITFQTRVQPWLLACFGAEIAADRSERNHRFLEESLELVQSCGCTASEAHQLVDYVFGRPVGEPAQEVGGVMVTLAALCLANSLDMHQAGETELARIWTKVEAIRAKQAAKPKHSPLPAAPTAPPDWRIDTSTGRGILVYKNCSVIEAEQAPYVLGLITADAAAAPALAAPAAPPPRTTGYIAPKGRYVPPVLFNPYTGEPRDARDIASDPQGVLIVPPGADLLAAAPQAPAALDELRQIAEIAACWGCEHPDKPSDTELLRRVKWAARQLRAVAQAPAAPAVDVLSPERMREEFTAWAEVAYRHEEDFTKRDFEICLKAWRFGSANALLAAQAAAKGENGNG